MRELRIVEGMYGNPIKKFSPVNSKVRDAMSINLSQNVSSSKGKKKNPFDLQTSRKFEDLCDHYDVSEKRFETNSSQLLPEISTRNMK